MQTRADLVEAIGRAREGSQQRMRQFLQSSPRRAHALLRASIRQGLIGPAGQVDEGSLIMDMMMSRNSIRSALQKLTDERLVTRRQRLGTTVVGSIAELPLMELLPISGLARNQEIIDGLALEPLEHLVVLADRHIRTQLHLDTESVLLQEDLLTLHGEPIGIIVGYYRIPDGWTGTDEARREISRDFTPGTFTATVEAVSADERTARSLGIPAGTALLVRETLVHDDAGNPRMLAYGHYRGDRVALRAFS